jgi:hypothetical protein
MLDQIVKYTQCSLMINRFSTKKKTECEFDSRHLSIHAYPMFGCNIWLNICSISEAIGSNVDGW